VKRRPSYAKRAGVASSNPGRLPAVADVNLYASSCAARTRSRSPLTRRASSTSFRRACNQVFKAGSPAASPTSLRARRPCAENWDGSRASSQVARHAGTEVAEARAGQQSRRSRCLCRFPKPAVTANSGVRSRPRTLILKSWNSSSSIETPSVFTWKAELGCWFSVGLILVFRISRQKRAITKHSL